MDSSLITVQLIKNSSIEQQFSFSENPQNDSEKLYQGILRVGRVTTSHIKIEDLDTPRVHSTIENQNGHFYITLMGNSKTFYNDSILKEKTEIKEFDEITIGDWKIRFFPHKTLEDIFNISEKNRVFDLNSKKNEVFDINSKKNEVFDINIKKSEALTKNSLESEAFCNENSKESDIFRNKNNKKNEALTKNSLESEAFASISELDEKPTSKKYEQSILTLDEPKAVGKGLEIKQYWQNNIVAVNLYQNRENITIGENLNDDFFIPNSFLPNEKSFTIAKTVAETGFSINFLLSRVKYSENDEFYNLEELLKSNKATQKDQNSGEIKLTFKTKIEFEIGDYRFEISSVPILKTVSKFSFLGLLDSFNLKFNTVSMIFHVALLTLLFLIPPDIESFSIEQLNDIPERYATIILDKKPTEKIKDTIKFDQKELKTAKTEFDAKLKPRDVIFDNTNINVSNLSKKQIQDKKAVQSSGLFIVDKKFKGLVGGNGSYGGIQDDNLRLTDNSDIISDSNINLTIRGTGSGNSTNSGIGPNGFFTKRGNPNGYRSISMNYENRKKKRDVVVARKGPDKITGNLTEEQIKGVVNKNISQIRYCYENELMRKPELSGSVTVKWKINPQGEVIDVSIEGGSLNNNAVHSCLISRIKKWRFPEPLGGGFALIIFPFNFHSN